MKPLQHEAGEVAWLLTALHAMSSYGGSHPSVTPGPGEQMLSSDLSRQQIPIHKYMQGKYSDAHNKLIPMF